MPAMQHRVTLTAADRTHFQQLLRANTTPARTAKRAQALLLTDRRGPRWPDAQVAVATGLSVRTVCRVRRDWLARGRDAVHARPRRTVTAPLLTDEQAARLLAIEAGPPPAGHRTWSLRMLASTAVELGIVPALSHETVRRTRPKRGSSAS